MGIGLQNREGLIGKPPNFRVESMVGLPKRRSGAGVSQVGRAIFGEVIQCPVGNQIESARMHVCLKLLIPDLGVVFGQPGSQFLKLTQGQGLYLALQFFHAAHD
jgi:hypothetical protein